MPDPTGSPTAQPRVITYVSMTAVRPAERNPRLHGAAQVAALAAFMARVGFTAPCIVDERTERLVAGHGRIEALVHLREQGQGPPEGVYVDDDGDWLVPLVRGWRSASDAEADAVVIYDNRANEQGEWHNKTTAQMLEDLNASDADLFDALGYDDEEMEALLRFTGDAASGEFSGQAPGSAEVEHALNEHASEDADLDGDGSTGGPGESSGKKQVRCPHCGGDFAPGDRF